MIAIEENSIKIKTKHEFMEDCIVKCFYHNDLDGRCAGSIVAMYENNYNKEDFFEVDYIAPLPLDKIQENEKVYLVDYSFKKDTIWQLEKILQKTDNVIWIDHHTSSFNLEKQEPWKSWLKNIKGIRKEGISGAGLTYMYLYNCIFDDLPYFIKLVSDYDCWIYKYEPDTTYFKIGMEARPFDALDNVWELLLCGNGFTEFDSSGAFSNIKKDGEVIKKFIDKDNEYYRNHFSYETEIEGLKCLVVNKKTNSWVFGEKYEEYPIVMVWVFNGEKYTYSIFSSNPDIDCSKIAEKYGGGGHKGAAGFSSDELLFKKVQLKKGG
jgi:oligoribonuclease NrnB/cAMP/cGMP phosphodiesterase (DHH superfamily)